MDCWEHVWEVLVALVNGVIKLKRVVERVVEVVVEVVVYVSGDGGSGRSEGRI
jgi:hypothetical protein